MVARKLEDEVDKVLLKAAIKKLNDREKLIMEMIELKKKGKKNEKNFKKKYRCFRRMRYVVRTYGMWE